jgi:4-amino-4-deoxy-L-arabinose transferase-like glycosyltransferase
MITVFVTIMFLIVALIRPNNELDLPLAPFVTLDCVLLMLGAIHYGII